MELQYNVLDNMVGFEIRAESYQGLSPPCYCVFTIFFPAFHSLVVYGHHPPYCYTCFVVGLHQNKASAHSKSTLSSATVGDHKSTSKHVGM